MTDTFPASKLPDLIRAVYDLSVPVGLGFLHAKPGSLTDAEVADIIELSKDHPYYAARMDYVNGRQCKMKVRRAQGGELEIPSHWPDHTSEHLSELLRRIGVSVDAKP
jgi:hypothetical protein